MRKLRVLLLLQVATICASAQQSNDYAAGFFTSGKDTLSYRYLEPLGMKKGQKYPVIIILHGSGERGNDNKLQLVHGGKLFIDPTVRANFPAFIIFPQCKPGKSWTRVEKDRFSFDSLGGLRFRSAQPPTTPLSLVMQLLDSVSRQPTVDRSKIYVGGLSMGGMGTFELLWRKPGFFCAAFLICGGGDPTRVSLYREVPLWIFHGEKDPVVKVGNSRRMVNAFRAAGGRAKYSEYKGVVHNSWDNAFAEPGLLPWLFSYSRKNL
ncbi:MAG TPA: dienelactone hydrolase family protein [Flavitalea sp.]|nr:dienelactone hydrolase family protein [Flavitalea sp.]